jgi:enoyl-CoA hydratase
MAYQNFLLEKQEQIATLTLNRPEKRNPVNEEMLGELEMILMELREDRETRVVIVTGTGNTFCAGADISHLKGITDPIERQKRFIPVSRNRGRLLNRVNLMLEQLEQVTIAAINGYAIGAGLGLALACDFRIAAAGTQFWLPEVDLGVPLGTGSTARLTRLVGPAKAKELIMTGDRFDSTEALRLGLLYKVVPAEQLPETTWAFAKKLAGKNPRAMALSKAIVNVMARGNSGEATLLSPEHFVLLGED